MKILERLRKPAQKTIDRVPVYRAHAAPNARKFAAAAEDRLIQSLSGTTQTINEEIRAGLVKMRARSRQLCNDNDYAKRFLGMVAANVVGPKGITLQAQPRRPDGTIDRLDAELIEQTFATWARPTNCTMAGHMSWQDVQRLAAQTVARDGECFVQLVRTRENSFGLALHVFEADHVDVTLNRAPKNGNNEIRLGIEINRFGRPVAYFVRRTHPGDGSVHLAGAEYDRVPADQMIHMFRVERPGQLRGVPWMHTAIRRLNQLGGYEEAELVAARTAASKMGFYTSPEGDPALIATSGNADEGFFDEAEPGAFSVLPQGYDFKAFDPQHPVSAFADFVRATLRGAAAGLGVSYHGLSNDLENVNFSSIRSGVLEEREQWKVLQAWFAEQLCERVYQAWLVSALATGRLNLPASNIEKFRNVKWQPRGWAWVDPLKDAQANEHAVRLGVLTRAEIAASQGRDLDDILEQLAAEEARMRDLGLNSGDNNGNPQAND